MKISFFFFAMLVTFAAVSINAQNCKYDKNGYRTVPCENYLVEFKLGKYKRLAGKVVTPNGEKPIPAVIVSLHRDRKTTTFVGSLSVDENGEFCFKDLPKGKYILKIGAQGFQCIDIYFEIAPNNKKSKREKLTVELEVGI